MATMFLEFDQENPTSAVNLKAADSRVGDLNRSLTSAPHVLYVGLNMTHDIMVYCQYYIIYFVFFNSFLYSNAFFNLLIFSKGSLII
jgi:hypothetical protein